MNGFDLSTISSIYVGSTQYSQIYIGSNKLWPLQTVLPYDAEIEYLESTGTQWIDIGYKHHSGLTKYETSVVLTNIQNNYNSLFGARITHNGAEAYYIGVTGNGVAYSCIGSNKKDSLCSLSINTRYDIVSDPSTGWIINGTTYSSAANNTSTRSLYNCYLYSLNQSDTNIENVSMRIYHFVIYEGSTLIMDMIPVRVGQTGYMYDKVGGQLYGNNGTGNFILGRDKLPTGYTELEYISSSSGGNQYIDLGIKLYETLNTNYDIAMKFNIASGNANQAAIFACQDSDNDPWPGTFVRANSGTSKVIGRYIGGTAKDNTLGNIGTDIELQVQTSPNKNVTSLNNNNTTHQYGTSLFCAFVGGTNTPARYCNAILYYFKLFVGGTLVRDLIPCKNSNNIVGMYDLINKVFYTSPNGAAFAAGPEINLPYDAEIQYLESTGTQWIDTLIHPTTGYGFEVYGGFTTLQNDEFFGGGTSWGNGLGICTHDGNTYGIIVGNTEVCRITAENNVMHLFKVNTDGTVYVDNEYKGQSTTAMPDGSYTMNIFRHSSTQVPLQEKIYYVKIYNSTGLLFDGVPVRVGQVGYMYDKISKQLFTNAGTGNFTLGPDIT